MSSQYVVQRRPDNSDLAEFAWSGLRRHTSISYVTRRLTDVHAIPDSQSSNARKQAAQIQACLRQSKEYYDAARNASSAVAPVLLYYSASSLATAQALFLGTGDFSLDKKRKIYNRHGLKIDPAQIPQELDSIYVSVERTCDRALTGTFGIWFLHSYQDPILADFQDHLTRKSVQTRVVSSDTHCEDGGFSHIDVIECFRNIPELVLDLDQMGIETNLCRAELVQTARGPGPSTFRILPHPAPDHRLEKVFEAIHVSPRFVHEVDLVAYESRLGLILVMDPHVPGAVRFPGGSCRNADRVFFRVDPFVLNDFGCLYVPLFAASMWSRYNPEGWMRAVNEGQPIAVLTERLCDIAFARLPLLTLQTLDQTIYIDAA